MRLTGSFHTIACHGTSPVTSSTGDGSMTGSTRGTGGGEAVMRPMVTSRGGERARHLSSTHQLLAISAGIGRTAGRRPVSYPGRTALIRPRPDAVEGADAARFLLSGRSHEHAYLVRVPASC